MGADEVMGLLDNLFSEDPKQQALVQMALGLLQGSPNGHKNFGADLGYAGGQGLLGYNSQRAQQAKMAEEAQQRQLRDIALRTAQQTYSDEQTARDVFARRRGVGAFPGMDAIQSGENVGSMGSQAPQPMPQQAPQQMPPQMPQQGSQMGPQGIQSPQGGPTVIPFGKGVTATTAPQGATNGKFSTFNKYNSIADDLEQAGALTKAQQYRDLAEKYRPKLKDEQVRLKNGVPMVVRNYEDGTTEESPYNPTANIEYLDTKNAKLPIDKNTGKTAGSPIPMGIDPAEAQRLQNERSRLYFETGMGGPGGRSGAPGTPGLAPKTMQDITKSQAEGLNTGGIAYKNGLDTTVQTGNDLMTRIAESRRALDQFKPGMGAESYLNVARAAQAAHMPDGLVKAIAGGDVASIQEFQKLSAQQAMETLKSAMGGSGRITQAEFKVFQQNNPNIELDPNAIKKIYDFAEKTHRRNVAEQASMRTYLKEGNDISQWPAEWTKRTGGGTPPASGFRYLGKE
jgi:hypothetical protein